MDFVTTSFAGVGIAAGAIAPDISRVDARPVESRFETYQGWSTRSFEAGETTRLNQAHWHNAQDRDINLWLSERLSTIRARAIYERRNNPLLAGMSRSLADDVVGCDGPILTIQSDDETYNAALAEAWRLWFRAPTFSQNVSGVAWLKMCVGNLPSCGEFLATIGTDNRADGPVKMRLWPRAPRLLIHPEGDFYPYRLMGIERNEHLQPTRYWFRRHEGLSAEIDPYSPDDVIHEFMADEEGQVRGYPWLTSALQPAADLRDFDDQTLDAARQEADNMGLLYTDHQDAPVWATPESTDVERRTIKMAPPGWKPFQYMATTPPVQYPAYRLERHRELGRPFNMPAFMVRLDSSGHNYSSVRMDMQSYGGFVSGVQMWLSGSPDSVGLLNRLLDLVAAEARFEVPALRNRPARVTYEWTWPKRPHVDPMKEAQGLAADLASGCEDGISALAARGQTIERHIANQKRFVAAYEKADLEPPAYAAPEPVPDQTADQQEVAANG